VNPAAIDSQELLHHPRIHFRGHEDVEKIAFFLAGACLDLVDIARDDRGQLGGFGDHLQRRPALLPDVPVTIEGEQVDVVSAGKRFLRFLDHFRGYGENGLPVRSDDVDRVGPVPDRRLRRIAREDLLEPVRQG